MTMMDGNSGLDASQGGTGEMAGVAVQPVNNKAAPQRRLSFNGSTEFQNELRRRVEDYFAATGAKKRDLPRMYAKSAIIMASTLIAYLLLVFAAQTWWQGLFLAIWLGVSMAGIGFNVMHDGGHDAYSENPRINRIMALALDLIGGSSYLWRWKHSVIHHTYVNITGHDADVDVGVFGRLTPHHKRLAFHRWQHIYLWPLYGFLALKWHFYDDFHDVLVGKIGSNPVPRPTGRNLLLFAGFKAAYFGLALVLPMFFHTWWVVLIYFALTDAVLGLVMAVVFQLAHVVEQADFPQPSPQTGKMEQAWAVHQVETTVDFARDNRLVSWLLGGLNFQVVHHLFPRICHVNYPAISRIVEETCEEFGIRYNYHPSFTAGVVEHFRWLRKMGQPTSAV